MELNYYKDDISDTTDLAGQYPDIVNELCLIGDSTRTELDDRIKTKKAGM
jgi:hypothetical protein